MTLKVRIVPFLMWNSKTTERPNIFVKAIFIVLWSCLFTTKLSCLQKNKFGHTKVDAPVFRPDIFGSFSLKLSARDYLFRAPERRSLHVLVVTIQTRKLLCTATGNVLFLEDLKTQKGHFEIN